MFGEGGKSKTSIMYLHDLFTLHVHDVSMLLQSTFERRQVSSLLVNFDGDRVLVSARYYSCYSVYIEGQEVEP